MDEKRVATIYDYYRYCLAHKETNVTTCDVEKINDMVLKWCDEHPVKTRLTEFKKLFPNCKLDPNGYPFICICEQLDTNWPSSDCYTSDEWCTKCSHKIWDEEVE